MKTIYYIVTDWDEKREYIYEGREQAERCYGVTKRARLERANLLTGTARELKSKGTTNK